jgi:hypothetical protein
LIRQPSHRFGNQKNSKPGAFDMRSGKGRVARRLAAVAAGLLRTACGGAGDSATATAVAPGLPLQIGFYVAEDTPCNDASNATLSLFFGDALNGARDACAFTAIGSTGQRAWNVTERCTTFGDPSGEFTQIVAWTSEHDRAFRRVTESGWEHSARFCPQPELPEPWRDNDLSDL